ncbi:hypothetical protein D0X99_09845 [Algoriphagus lacus]|uniref:DoxX family membrane protein n=1 Tax=Algoriphagus lacus TaxID=2056311 RepID=A0A418PRZ7_9BACT|nr:hypothetical protein [Algoriphagus lacus]RIW15717.1 hypothetical protein D0X99_09845 [Algoriphagus lacus]
MNKLIRFGRISLFIIYFWFGILKVLGISPAEPLVNNLFDQILAGIIPFDIFSRLFGLFECIIGIIWLFPQITRMALYILLIHMVSTFLPVLLLPNDTWHSWFTPTLVGQYIIKNFALIALGMIIFQVDQPKTRTPEVSI